MFEDKSNGKTQISDLGEFGLIDHLTQHIKLHHKSTVKGVGDDAAVISGDDKSHIVVTTDMLVEGVHFDLGYMPLKHLGYKAVIVNLSDVYAMNAQATQITVSVAVSNRFPVEAMDELYAGIKTACDMYQVDLIGGDTTTSPTGLIISVTAIGVAAPEEVIYRSVSERYRFVGGDGRFGSRLFGITSYGAREASISSQPECATRLGTL